MNLINNIKSLSILSSNKSSRNKKNKEELDRYHPIKTEDNIYKIKNAPFNNIFAKSIKSKNIKNKEIKNSKLNRTTDYSNTNDNSNSNENSNFNTNIIIFQKFRIIEFQYIQLMLKKYIHIISLL